MGSLPGERKRCPEGVKAPATSLAMVGVKWERKVCALGVAEGEGKGRESGVRQVNRLVCVVPAI